MHSISRRDFLRTAGFVSTALLTDWVPAAEEKSVEKSNDQPAEPIIDIHQHTSYHGRTIDQLLMHQRAMGVTQTILLPAGSPVKRPSTGDGKYNGLGGVRAGGNDTVLALARQYPKEYLFGANDVTDLPEAVAEISRYIDMGAIVIGEQKFTVECDSEAAQSLYKLAGDRKVPILMHFQHGTYNLGYERLPAMLKKFPDTVFIGHAQTVWANIDKNHTNQNDLYPKGKVTPGGLTDRYLADFPNFFADMSAGSGLNSLLRDEDHTRGFLDRHQNKILYGSDCADPVGTGTACQGAQTIAALRKLSPSKAAERKMLYENARKLFQLS